MKDRREKQQTVRDLLAEHQGQEKNPLRTQSDKASLQIKEDVMTDQEVNDIKEYNRNITNLDPLYANIKPLHDILVRVYLIEPQLSESGLFLPHTEEVPVKTQNGIGVWNVTTGFPYSTKAVVVAVPDGSNLQPGNIVQLAPNQIKADVVGASNNAIVTVKNAFLHSDRGSVIPPKDVTNQHYGYLLVPYYEVKAVL